MKRSIKLLLTGFSIGFIAFQCGRASASTDYCHSFAELNRAIAIEVGTTDPDGDAAYNDAADLCEESSYDRALAEANASGACYIQSIAGGWMVVQACDEQDSDETVRETVLTDAAVQFQADHLAR